MNRYNLALLLLTLAVVPVFFVSGWLSALAIIAIYCLVARLANMDLDRQSGRRHRLYSVALSFEMTWQIMVYCGLESRHFDNALNGRKADIAARRPAPQLARGAPIKVGGVV
jgi:cyanate permease